jgi:hypothetical protein
MLDRLFAAGLLLSIAFTAQAAPTTPNPAHEVTAQEVVYAVPGMDRVVVKPDVPYKKAGGVELKLDLYYPPDYRERSGRSSSSSTASAAGPTRSSRTGESTSPGAAR